MKPKSPRKKTITHEAPISRTGRVFKKRGKLRKSMSSNIGKILTDDDTLMMANMVNKFHRSNNNNTPLKSTTDDRGSKRNMTNTHVMITRSKSRNLITNSADHASNEKKEQSANISLNTPNQSSIGNVANNLLICDPPILINFCSTPIPLASILEDEELNDSKRSSQCTTTKESLPKRQDVLCNELENVSTIWVVEESVNSSNFPSISPKNEPSESVARDQELYLNSSLPRLSIQITEFESNESSSSMPELECNLSISPQRVLENFQFDISINNTEMTRGDFNSEPRNSVVIDPTEDVIYEEVKLPSRVSRLHEDFSVKKGESLKRRFKRQSSMKIVPLRPLVKIEEEELATISERLSNISLNALEVVTHSEDPTLARRKVLLMCGQEQPVSFDSLYNERTLKNCKKIGEGTFAEVFCFQMSSNKTCVMKVIPIEGDQLVNDVQQKKFLEILSEITIAKALSDLRRNDTNSTDTFNELIGVRCVQGVYPRILMEQWDEWSTNSQNEHPRMFTSDQLYLILELGHGGESIEGYIKSHNPRQKYHMFQQIAFSLAIAETQLKFEHRDLHCGNVLLSEEKLKSIKFQLDGTEYCIPTGGVRATIIDFTLSRVELENMVVFNDLSEDDELFEGDSKVDYQFEIYRLMKEKNGNNWQDYQPYTNLLWLDYLLDKIIDSSWNKKKKSKKSTPYKRYIKKLLALREKVLTYRSVSNFVLESKLMSL